MNLLAAGVRGKNSAVQFKLPQGRRGVIGVASQQFFPPASQNVVWSELLAPYYTIQRTRLAIRLPCSGLSRTHSNLPLVSSGKDQCQTTSECPKTCPLPCLCFPRAAAEATRVQLEVRVLYHFRFLVVPSSPRHACEPCAVTRQSFCWRSAGTDEVDVYRARPEPRTRYLTTVPSHYLGTVPR